MKVLFWSSISPRKRKLLLWALGLLLLYTVTGFLILPPIVRSIAVKQLSQQLNREVSIEQVKINPFALSTTVCGLLIKDRDGEPFVLWDEVYVNFQASSLFTRAWTFKEISTSRPHVRVQMNWDYTFNFSDILEKFSTNAAPAKPPGGTKPLALRIARLHIGGATAAYADYTTREPFKRLLGPLDITLADFRTDPDNKNPYAFTGTTDAGERISWSGFFYLEPLRSQGSLTLDKFTLNKYAPLYQDLVRFEVRDGNMGVHLNYKFELSPTNRVMQVSDAAFALRDFKMGVRGESNNIAELAHFAVTGASADLQSHAVSVDSVLVNGGNLFVQRNPDQSVNVVEMAKPETGARAPGGIVFLLRSVTNVVAMLLNSTNQWIGTVQNVDVTNCTLHLEDLANPRPARLDLNNIRLSAKNISNLAGTNLTAEFSMRWNTNGSIKVDTTASFVPPTAEIQLDIDQLDLSSLDPYLEPMVNLYILGSKIGLHGKVNLTTAAGELPQVTFHGDAGLDDFHTVDGDWAEDLLKWDALRFNGIDANLNPQTVSIKEIVADNVYARVVIETNKTINLLNALRMTNAPATNAVKAVAAGKDSTAVTNAPLPQVSIGAIIITNTQVSFTDRSLTPEVNLGIRDVNGTVAGISTEQRQHAVVDLNAKVDGVGPASITGLINPLNHTATNSIKISLKDMDLTPASPYAAKYAGYRIAQGKLNLDLNYELVGKKLSSKNVITLDRFAFGEKVASPDATHLPVRLGIAILKDREGKIVLDVPVDGRLDDPKFHVSKVMWGAIENILVKVATSPFSLLGALVGGGGEELGYQDFAPGNASLTADGKKKLDALTKALHERPALGLEIAGSVDPDGDHEGLERVALDRQIRAQVWRRLRKSEQATNLVDQITLTPEDRAHWIGKFYGAAVSGGKITPELIAANTNLAALAAQVTAGKPTNVKAAALLKAVKGSAPTDGATYRTKLVPPPDATEALLLATYPISESDLETLAAARAKAVQNYLLGSGQVEAARLFLKSGGLRVEGSRAYLQFQ